MVVVDTAMAVIPRRTPSREAMARCRHDDFSFDGAPDPHVALGNDGYKKEASLALLSSNNGKQVYAWTVNDPDRMAELADMGIDGLITDTPDVARAVVDGTAPDAPTT